MISLQLRLNLKPAPLKKACIEPKREMGKGEVVDYVARCCQGKILAKCGHVNGRNRSGGPRTELLLEPFILKSSTFNVHP
jgi:hypothetical protein